MKKIVFILILAFFVLVGVSFAQMPYYFVNGRVTVTAEGGDTVPNRSVSFYKTLDQQVTAETDADGYYEIDVFGLFFEYGVPITFETEPYYIAVAQTGTGEYGGYETEEVIYLGVGAGYTEEALVIIEGSRQPEETTEEAEGEVPEGTVPLFISRSGNDIMVSWEASEYTSPEIYVLYGDGTGSFTNETDSWNLISSELPPVDFNYDNYSDGYILHADQVGEGSVEVYYRALELGENTSLLSSAEAVGKFNLDLYTGWNFVGSPFSSSEADTVLGTDFTDGDQIWSWNDEDQEYSTILTFASETWGTYSFTRGKGVLLYLAGSNQTVTLLGAVDLSTSSRSVYENWNFIANPFPDIASMSDFTGAENGDQLWDWDGENQEYDPVVTYDGGWTEGTQIEAGKNYFYYRVGSEYAWERAFE